LKGIPGGRQEAARVAKHATKKGSRDFISHPPSAECCKRCSVRFFRGDAWSW